MQMAIINQSVIESTWGYDVPLWLYEYRWGIDVQPTTRPANSNRELESCPPPSFILSSSMHSSLPLPLSLPALPGPGEGSKESGISATSTPSLGGEEGGESRGESSNEVALHRHPEAKSMYISRDPREQPRGMSIRGGSPSPSSSQLGAQRMHGG